jgi:hypothetical protein
MILNKKLNDYIKKSNEDFFCKIIERNKLINNYSIIYNIKNILANETKIVYKLDNKVDNNHDYLSSLANLNDLNNLTNKNNSKQNNIIVLIPKLITGTTIFIGITYLIIKMFLI